MDKIKALQLLKEEGYDRIPKGHILQHASGLLSNNISDDSMEIRD